jgi:hypothetical protein
VSTADRTTHRHRPGKARSPKAAPADPRAAAGAPARGWSGWGGGRVGWLEAPTEWRGTTRQVCGIWPYIVGSGTPMIGVPLGRDLRTQATVCCDPISWFVRAGLIANPSAFVLGKPGLGKSTVVRRMATGLAAAGVLPAVFGDLKPDYVALILALGGNVVAVGRGQGHLNVLDPGSAAAAAQRLIGSARHKLLADCLGRRLTMVAALVSLNRRGPVSDLEEAIILAALQILDDTHAPGHATLRDLIAVLEAAPDAVRSVVLDRGQDIRYRAAVDPLQASLGALCSGALGDTFAARTTVAISLDQPLCIDISGIADTDEKLQASVLLASWAEGFAAIAAAQALADAGLEPQRHFFVVLDELWRVLRAGEGLVDRVDALTRLNRQIGVGMALVTHSMDDLLALPSEADRLKARGFAERAGFIISAGLAASQLPALNQIVTLSEPERALLASWSSPPAWDCDAQREMDAPGRGKLLIKVGGRPGIPVEVVLTDAEAAANDTNRQWRQR